MKKFCYFIAVVEFLGLTACTYNVASYPQNEAALKRQIVNFQYTDSGMGGGPVTVTMSDGEVLNGQYTAANSGVSQTSIQATGNTVANTNATAFGAGGVAFGQGTTTSTTSAYGSGITIGPSGNGMANLIGNQGTMMRCIYTTNNFTGKGTGTCETNKGEVYAIHF